MLLEIFCLFGISFVLLITPSLTIEVTPNSRCSSLCMDSSTANPGLDMSSLTLKKDLVCSDSEYIGSEQTPSGTKWKDCLSCEQKSNATDAKTKQNDLYWFLCTFCAFLPLVLVRFLWSITNYDTEPR